MVPGCHTPAAPAYTLNAMPPSRRRTGDRSARAPIPTTSPRPPGPARRQPRRCLLAVVALTVLAPLAPVPDTAIPAAFAQEPAVRPPTVPPHLLNRNSPEDSLADSLAGSDLRVSLVTMGPGRAVWELFGHNALLIENTRTGERLAYNWGLFDFADEDFYSNFIRGAMRYWMAPFDADGMIAAYTRDGRDVYEQVLNLTPVQRARLHAYVDWNALEENSHYHYDYFLDNCSTRIRDVIDLALGGALRTALDTQPTGTTFRWHSRRLTQVQPLTYIGIEAGLASPTDRPISAWAESFLPMQLREHVRTVQVTAADGRAEPLVLSERVLYDGPLPGEPALPPTWWPWFLAAGVVVGVVIVQLARSTVHGSRTAANWLAGFTIGWSSLAGIAGLLILFLWFGTAHSATQGNWNVLQFNPLSLVLVPLLPGMIRNGRARAATRRIAAVVASLAVVGAALVAVPLQYTIEMVALALPIHLAVAWAVSRVSRAG